MQLCKLDFHMYAVKKIVAVKTVDVWMVQMKMTPKTSSQSSGLVQCPPPSKAHTNSYNEGRAGGMESLEEVSRIVRGATHVVM